VTAAQQKRAELFGAFFEIIVRTESRFALLGATGFFALRFQFNELLRRQNPFGATEKCLAALFVQPAFMHSACHASILVF